MSEYLEGFLEDIRFKFIQPYQTLPKGFQRFNRWLAKLNIQFDVLNTLSYGIENDRKKKVEALCKMPRMSSYAIGLIINKIVALMPSDQAYLNVGVWNGFSFFCGLSDNRDKVCIGIDNFSKWGGPKSNFLERFDTLKSPNHYFDESDYQDYLTNTHGYPLGFYFYDGDHAYEHQKNGLLAAERFFGDKCIIMVDDTNWHQPRQATFDFMEESNNTYKVLLDVQTAPLKGRPEESAMHPTFWNGIMVAQKIN